MRWHYKLWLRLRTLFRKRGVEQDLSEELRLHLERLTEENLARGMSPAEARQAALREFGGLEQIKEECRDARGVRYLDELAQDLRFGMRQLRRTPGFTLVAMITLALGIGATTAIFSVIDAVLLRPLPYKDASRIMMVVERFPRFPGSAFVLSPEFPAWRKRNRVFEQKGAYTFEHGANLTGVGEPVHVSVGNVTPGLFSVFGARPMVGRGFVAEEAKQGAPRVALLSEALWRSRFGADRHVVGKTIRLDGDSYRVVGVAAGSLGLAKADVWTPLALDAPRFSPHNPFWAMLQVYGRLKGGVSVTQARADLQVLTEQMNREYAAQAAPFRKGVRVDVTPLHELLVLDSGRLLLVLLASVACLLLIACANVANLLLSRGVARAGEMAVRAALGAGRMRLVRQSLAESFVLAAGGGVLGLAAGVWGTRFLRQLVPEWLPVHVQLDATILAASAVLVVLALLAFGLAPALFAARPDAGEAMRQAATQASGGVATHRLQGWLSAGEIALSLVLLVAAGLLVRSFLRLTNVPLGFDPHGVLLATVDRPVTAGADPHRDIAVFREALDRIRGLAGVEEAAVASGHPLGLPGLTVLMVDVQGAGSMRLAKPASVTAVSADYFRVMRIRMDAGRLISDADAESDTRVAVVGGRFAGGVLKGRGAMGRHIRLGGGQGEWIEVVGVVADTRDTALDQEPGPAAFVPYAQLPAFGMSFLIRTKADPRALVPAVRKAVLSVDKNQPLSEATTMDDFIAKTIAPERFRMLLLGLFAALALVLAVVGVYGVIAYSCSRRTREFGIRAALGAGRGDIVALVVRQAARMAVIGVVLGLAAAFALTRLLAGYLYGTKPDDPVTFVAVPLVLLASALLAAYVPARRAAHLDPARLLRDE